MLRERLTPDRIRRFTCPADAKQSFLWDTDAPRLAVRATTGAKSFIFEAKLNRQTIRVTIGDVKAWNLDDARAEARRLQTQVDQGIDPRQEKADKLAAVEAKREEERRVEALALEAWNAYIEARKARWSEPHIRDHENVSKEGGELRTRGRIYGYRFRPAGRLRGSAALLASLACLTPLALGFLLPAGLLLRMALGEGDAQFGERFAILARNSFTLAGLTALVAVMLAVVLAYSARLSKTLLAQGLNRLVGLGYAVPGTVIAVGVLIPVTRLDNWLAGQWENAFGSNPGLLLTGGIAALIYAYLARFLSVALQTVETSLSKITPSMDDAARSLGLGQGRTLRRVHLPILRGSLYTAGLLVFVDVMKELPATLVMRPFNFDTLATQAYTLAADERLAEASTASLAIVAVGLLPLIALSRQIAKRRR
mgnify:CR=1 FL=1